MSAKNRMPANPSWAMVERGRVRFYEQRRKLTQDHPKARAFQAFVDDDTVIVEDGSHKTRLVQHGKSPEEAIRNLNKILS